MQVNWDTQILDLKGKPIYADVDGLSVAKFAEVIEADTSDEDKVKAIKAIFTTKAPPITLGDIVGKALLENRPGAEQPKGLDKHRRFKLALLAAGGGTSEIKTEEASDIKLMVEHLFNPLIYGRVYDLIEGCQPPAT